MGTNCSSCIGTSNYEKMNEVKDLYSKNNKNKDIG